MIGLPVMLLCLALQAAVSFWSVRFYMRQIEPTAARRGLFPHLRPLLIVMIAMMLGNFIQIVIWGVLFIWRGRIQRVV